MPPRLQKRLAVQFSRIEAALEALKKLLVAPEVSATKTLSKREKVSPEGRARMAEAQRKRWAKQKKRSKKIAKAT